MSESSASPKRTGTASEQRGIGDPASWVPIRASLPCERLPTYSSAFSIVSKGAGLVLGFLGS